MSEAILADQEDPETEDGALSDDEILGILRSEWEGALGEGDELEEDRARALDYIHGDPDRGYMRKDLPPSPDMSKATSSDVSDAIETVLPDLIEIFTGGEDVVAFSPNSEEDEKQAEQETDYVNHVFYTQNEGWMTLYTVFKDALASKTGVIKWWWEEEDYEERRTAEASPGSEELVADFLASEGWARDEEVAPEVNEAGLVRLSFRRTVKKGCAKIAAVPPEDFRIDPGAKCVADATWAAMRSRQRVHALVKQGLPRDLLIGLPEVSTDGDEQTDSQARDFTDEGVRTSPSPSPHPMMKLVEVREYHAWLPTGEDGAMECWRVVTGGEDSVLLDRERIDGVQFEVLCPYPVTHRLYGRSLADLTVEVQKIKTALMRLMLDHAYQSVNPRTEVGEQGASQYTLSDLVSMNKPGGVIRSTSGQAVRWLSPPQLGFDIFGALEYASTVAESRTGVVRNAQGLNPDTLHDTAKGAMELMGAAQRRVRMIARIFAETGLRRFFLGLHDLIVKHSKSSDYVRLRNSYVQVDPSKWGRRKDLVIDVGLGTNTKSYELQFWQMVLSLQAQAAQMGVSMRPEHYWAAIKRLLKAGNVRNPDMFFPNPANAPEGQEQQAPPPDPEMVKVQAEMQLKEQKAQADMQMEQQKFQFEAQLALYKTQVEAGLAEQAMQTEARLQEIIAARKMQLEEFKAATNARTKAMGVAISAQAKMRAADHRIADVRFGGDLG